MQSLEATIYCPNFQCQAPNPESHHFCQQCRSILPKRYLWAAGNEPLAVRPGTLLGDRYWYKWERIFLDTKPGSFPEAPEVLPEAIEAYLRLIAHTPHIPEVYTSVFLEQKHNREIWLLENGPIYLVSSKPGTSPVQEGALMPTLEAEWQHSSPIRQLSWLYQQAQLWDVCLQEKVARSLLVPALLRVEGSLIRLLELQFDPSLPTLADLGNLWQQWVPTSHPTIASFLESLCQQMVQGRIHRAEQVAQLLDGAIAFSGQTQHRQIQIATLTDKGPSRQRNEDACFPESGQVLTFPIAGKEKVNQPLTPLAIVCDGIGGHEGGNVASNLAISVLQDRLQGLSLDASITPDILITQLEQAVLAANDVISQRNDAEQRQERQRMGTTLVMALGYGHELYITHVGDSRAYRITPIGCHQVTLDDDLASREVRLGYSLRWDASRQPGSGSLVQAIGMSASSMLHPTVQRFVLNESCLFLLCSDGLSDNDRVEQYWHSVLLPVLEGKLDLSTAVQQLVAIANLQNGHDNVTVGLVHCQVASAPAMTVPASMAVLSDAVRPNHAEDLPASSAAPPRSVTRSGNPTASTLKTQNLKPIKRNRPGCSTLLLGLLLILGLGGGLTFLLLDGARWLTQENGENPISSPPVTTPPIASPSAFRIGTRLLVNRAASGTSENSPLALSSQPNTAPDTVRANLPLGTVLEVISQRQDSFNQQWLGIKVCSLPQIATSKAEGATVAPTLTAQPGELGWIREEAIVPFVTSNVSLTDTQLGNCASERRTLPSN